jgi:hypothetical protein
VTLDGVQGVYAPGLTPETTYRIHYLYRDAQGAETAVSSSGTFTTLAMPAFTGVRQHRTSLRMGM